VVWDVAQDEYRPALLLRLHGPAGAIGPWSSLLRRMLGLDVELGPFYAAAARVPVLAELAERFRGLKPPRFATLWESLVNTIAFQQLSLASGMAAVGRLVRRCASPVAFDGAALSPFPAPEAVSGLTDAELRACGFSRAKARSLRAAAGAVLNGALREDELERLPDAAVVERLRQVPGVGPWTSSLVLLRGMGRLTSFPMGDSGVNRRLRAVFGATDAAPLLATLGDFRGMLYFNLLLSSRYADRVTVARPRPPSSPAVGRPHRQRRGDIAGKGG
jgi:DNA-3-methyladenine glycosylase II